MIEEREKITGQIQIPADKVAQLQAEIINIDVYKKEIEKFIATNVTQLIEIVLAGAVFLDSSDIHIEPEEQNAKLRLRLDGVLQDVLILNLGYSHPIEYKFPEGTEIKVEKNVISIHGIDKQLVGQTAAEIRSLRKPEPYKGKGIK